MNRTRSCVATALLALALSAGVASAVTSIGANFDSNLSVIYNSSLGNVFLENSPLSNPAVQQLVIASAGGLLLPGNLTLPSLSPPVTITSATPTLIDVTWSPGNFLGTGSSLGSILSASLTQATLLADLTISWAPVSSSLASGDLLYGTYGNMQSNPVMPASGAAGFFRFFNVATGQFFDPPWAVGYDYQMTDGSLFTSLGLPIGYGNSFSVVVGGSTIASGLTAGSAFTFAGPGVSSFSLLGIAPAVDAAFGDAFPLYLAFSAPTASFNMNAIPVPEPTVALLLLTLGGLAARRREPQSIRGLTR